MHTSHRRLLGLSAALTTLTGLGLTTLATPAQAAPTTTSYITYVAYFNDAAHTNLVGSWTWNPCPGEQGSYGWGAQTSYYEISSEPCP